MWAGWGKLIASYGREQGRNKFDTQLLWNSFAVEHPPGSPLTSCQADMPFPRQSPKKGMKGERWLSVQATYLCPLSLP